MHVKIKGGIILYHSTHWPYGALNYLMCLVL
uniref:Uncharacterized protein n=1 Tax=Triticum urartu TaxID=4572 RepID=A0A8R7PLJ8_TRIUA